MSNDARRASRRGSAAPPLRLWVEALEPRRLLAQAPVAEGDYYRVEQGTSLRAEPSTAVESRQAFFASCTSPGAPAGFSGATTTAPVGGYANLGSVSNRFAGSMLRNDTGRAFSQGSEPYSAVIPTRLTLTDLPRHTSVDLNFLFAAIDSWDGNRETDVEGPADVFGVAIDGRLIFAETFDNTDAADQSYIAPPDVLLAYGQALGFNARHADSAYDLGRDPRFDGIPHDSDTLTVEWFAYGNGWTVAGREDESWAIDQVEVLLNGVPTAPRGVLANDWDPEGARLQATLVDRPERGSLALRADGGLTYIPLPTFVGNDSFTYRARDAGGQSDLAVVQIEVYPSSAAPVALDDSYVMVRGGSLPTAAEEVVKDFGTGFDDAAQFKLPDSTPDSDYGLVDPETWLPERSLAAIARVVPPGHRAVPDDASALSRWIAIDGDETSSAATYAFETTVDLSGFASSTAWMSGLKLAGQEALLSIWIDETRVLSETLYGGENFYQFGGLGRGAFHAGQNRIRFVVQPLAPASDAVALRVEGVVVAERLAGPAGVAANDVLPPAEHASGLVSVAGTSDPWLAGMPPGSRASDGDAAPGQSPVEVDAVQLVAGDVLRFVAEGALSNAPFVTRFPLVGPDGGALETENFFVRHENRAENGISDVVAPFNALVGVFLDDAAPNIQPPPGTLDFSPTGNVLGGVDYRRLAPALRQVFLIGDGFAADGHRHEVVVPARATRLFLGTMDGYGWFNNLGRFEVRVHSERFSVAADTVAVLVRGANHGALLLNRDGSFTYTPDAGFQGEDSFRYRLESSARERSKVVTVTIRVDPMPGDVDGDGRVDLTDFAVLKQNFGWPGDRSRGDLNADRFVNLNDFAILKANFGQTAEAQSADR